MNANELADELEGMGYLDWLSEAATMLRQQQAEIEALKAEIVLIEKNADYWANKSIKTLTDEEIAKLADDILGYQIYGYKESGVYDFARAILRKASE